MQAACRLDHAGTPGSDDKNDAMDIAGRQLKTNLLAIKIGTVRLHLPNGLCLKMRV
jgi:hypothetical protein